MPKTLLINPEGNVDPDQPNIGLAYIATILNAKVIDQNTRPYPKDRFLKFNADSLLISVRPFTSNEAKRISKAYKTKYPKSSIKSVSGIVDVFCCYPYIKFKNNKHIKNIFSDNLPFPKYELFDSFELFTKNWNSGKWQYPLLSSLGCPYQCNYCMSHNRKWIPRSAKNCYEELRLAKKKYKIKTFAPVEDCFNLNKKRVIDFCRLIKPLKLSWVCTSGLRVDRFDEDTAKAMADSGCIQVGFGVESFDDGMLKKIKKGVTVEQIKKTVRISKKYFNRIHCFFIIGLPGSSFKKDLDSLKWVIKEGIAGHFSSYIAFDKDYQEQAFYGQKVKIKSKEYSLKKQKWLYDLTKYMRADIKSIFIIRALNRLKLIWMFDKKNIINHIKNEFKNRVSVK